MEVLLTHEQFAPDFAGGGEYVVLELARSLIAEGAKVRVLTTGDPDAKHYDGIETTRLPVHRYRFNFAVDRILDMARDADIIHTFNYHACLPSLRAGRRCGKKVVCTALALFQDAWRAMRGPVLGPAWMAWERFVLTRPYDRTLFLSDHSLEQGLHLGVDPARALTVCPGIVVKDYRPASPKDDVVLFVGKIDVRKGIGELMQAARALPDASFRVVGWGKQLEPLRREAPPNVTVVELERGEALRREFARARIFVLPSRAETFGIALLEAMASGCAVVSTIPLNYEGVRLERGTAEEIIPAVRRLWDDRELTERQGRENHERAQPFSWKRHAQTLLGIYDDLLSA